VALYLNEANVLKGSLLSSGIQKAIGTLSAGIKLQFQMENGATEEQAMSRIMPVQLRAVVLFNPFISYSYFLTFCLLPVMLLVFVLLGSVYTLGNELQYGLGPEWLEAADNNICVALAGKLLPYTFLFYCLAMVINLILFRYLGLPLRGNLHVILVSEFLLIISYQFIAIFLVGITANLRLGISLGSAYSMLAITYSGLTFPIFGMPAFPQAFAHIFPFTYWLKIFISQTLRGEPVSNGIIPMYAFFAFMLLGITCIPRLKTLLKTEKYWGKL
ncbi:MAG: ABC transporter permease, partial [Bacteroidota bacterium]|nr:ABC transporter permease [Bacteroidota bacterium]